MTFTLAPEHEIPPEREARVARLLRGSVDLHCHSGPSLMPRALDSAQALEEAAAIGMRAVLELSSGHLNIREVWPLFEEAKVMGIRRMVVNHPTYIIGASLADIRGLVEAGAFIEHSIGMYVPVTTENNVRPDELRDVIGAGTVRRTFFGSDLGQRGNGHPVFGFRHMVSALIGLGYSDADITRMVSTNAAELVGLDETAAPTGSGERVRELAQAK